MTGPLYSLTLWRKLTGLWVSLGRWPIACLFALKGRAVLMNQDLGGGFKSFGSIHGDMQSMQ